MTRHTRNRQMVEVNRRNPHKKLLVRQEMDSINVTMESIYREPKVWDLDPNFHTVRVTQLRKTFRQGTFHYKTNKRLIDKRARLKAEHPRKKVQEVYEQLSNGKPYPLYIVENDDGTLHDLSMTYGTVTKTIYFYTYKQPHVSGNGNYFNRILGRTKYGERHYGIDSDLQQEYRGLYDSEGYRLVEVKGE